MLCDSGRHRENADPGRTILPLAAADGVAHSVPGGQSLHPAPDEVLARARDGCHEPTVPCPRRLITSAQVAGRLAAVGPEVLLTFSLALPGSIEDTRAG